MNKIILVTGGAGYIGSHTIVSLLNSGYEVISVDNYSNSHAEIYNKIERICEKRVTYYELDLRDEAGLVSVFEKHSIGAVIHFAGMKSVGESVVEPLSYYHNNINGSISLFKVMKNYDCKKLVFSSSATVYGDDCDVPIRENSNLSVTNPYGQTKLMTENMLRDISHVDPEFKVSILRYFNPIAAHKSGLIGDNPNGVPNNLMPYVAKVASGEFDFLPVFGNDYSTIDGTGVRDYIHVVDLADAHISALSILNERLGCHAYNIGTGQGYSVMQLVAEFERVSGKEIKVVYQPRRSGDVAVCYADPAYSKDKLKWNAQYNLNDMIQDQWNWQQKNS